MNACALRLVVARRAVALLNVTPGNEPCDGGIPVYQRCAAGTERLNMKTVQKMSMWGAKTLTVSSFLRKSCLMNHDALADRMGGKENKMRNMQQQKALTKPCN